MTDIYQGESPLKADINQRQIPLKSQTFTKVRVPVHDRHLPRSESP